MLLVKIRIEPTYFFHLEMCMFIMCMSKRNNILQSRACVAPDHSICRKSTKDKSLCPCRGILPPREGRVGHQVNQKAIDDDGRGTNRFFVSLLFLKILS